MSEITLAATETTQEADGCPVVGLPFGFSDRIGHTGWRRFASAAVTIGIHVAVIAAFCAVTHEAHQIRPTQSVMTVSLLPAAPAKPVQVNLSPAKLVQPEAVAMAAPVFTTNTSATTTISVPERAPVQATGGDPEKLKDIWAAKLIARLTAMKRYPREAVLAHEQGVVWLHFVIDRTGHVLNADIQKSSGFDALDKEALALAYRAQPLPPPPAGLPGISFDLALPIRFAFN